MELKVLHEFPLDSSHGPAIYDMLRICVAEPVIVGIVFPKGKLPGPNNVGRIQIVAFGHDGAFKHIVGGQGDTAGTYQSPFIAAVDSTGATYVCDESCRGYRRTEIYDVEGHSWRTVENGRLVDTEAENIEDLICDQRGGVLAFSGSWKNRSAWRIRRFNVIPGDLDWELTFEGGGNSDRPRTNLPKAYEPVTQRLYCADPYSLSVREIDASTGLTLRLFEGLPNALPKLRTEGHSADQGEKGVEPLWRCLQLYALNHRWLLARISREGAWTKVSWVLIGIGKDLSAEPYDDGGVLGGFASKVAVFDGRVFVYESAGDDEGNGRMRVCEVVD